jgi:hypothetical protein
MAKPSEKHHTVLTAEQRKAAVIEVSAEESRVKRADGKPIPYAWSTGRRTTAGKQTYGDDAIVRSAALRSHY